MSSKLLLFSLFIHGFQTTLFQTWNHIVFILIDSLKRSSNNSNWLIRIPTQSSLVNSELLFFITIQYTIRCRLASTVFSVGYWIVMKNKISELTRLDWVGIWLNQFGMFEEQENNVVLNENSFDRKPCINRESKSYEIKV